MATRDRFEIEITCPSCGLTGKGMASEKDYPFMRNPDFRVGLPEGFTLEKEADRREDTEVRCKCGEIFIENSHLVFRVDRQSLERLVDSLNEVLKNEKLELEVQAA